MKVIAFNGSPRKEGNTSILLNHVLEELKCEGIQTELIQLGGQNIRGCQGCLKCVENKDKRCVIQNDPLNEYVEKMIQADGILIGSPTYFANVSTEVKAMIDRAGLVARANGNLLKRKIGAAVVAVRRAGAVPTFNSINQFFLIEQMIVPGSIYWNMAFGGKPGQVDEDDEGLATMKALGENMAWLLKKLNA